MNALKMSIVVAVLAAWSCGAAAQTIVYVNINQTANPQDGTSWGTAWRFLRDGIDDARQQQQTEPEVEIWVAEGTYRPDQKLSHGPSANCPPYGNCSQSARFELDFDVSIYGGFPADSDDETNMEHRDPVNFETILSGDLNGDDDFDWYYDANGDLTFDFATSMTSRSRIRSSGATCRIRSSPHNRGRL